MLKSINTFLFITLSLAIYIGFGKIHWEAACALAGGNLSGGYLGSRIQLRKGEGFIRAFLVISGLVLAAKLVYDGVLTLF